MVTIKKSDIRSMKYQAVGELVPHPNNPRTHSPGQLKRSCQSNVAARAVR